MDRTVIAIFIAIGKSLFCIAFLKPSIRPYWWMSIPIHPLNYAYAKVGHFRCQRVIKCSAIDLHGWMVGTVINLPMRWIHWNLIVSKCNNVQRTLLYHSVCVLRLWIYLLGHHCIRWIAHNTPNSMEGAHFVKVPRCVCLHHAVYGIVIEALSIHSHANSSAIIYAAASKGLAFFVVRQSVCVTWDGRSLVLLSQQARQHSSMMCWLCKIEMLYLQ